MLRAFAGDCVEYRLFKNMFLNKVFIYVDIDA